MKKILIGYTSKTGSTRETAERIGNVIKNQGNNVEVAPIEKITSLDAYDKVILGTPINGMKILPDMNEFINQFKNTGKVDGVFILSYIYPVGRKMWKKAIGSELNRLETALKPKMSAIFGGRIKDKLPGIFNFLFGIPKNTPKDLRDWAIIETWAQKLSSIL